ncbi:hypothetical protein P792_16615 [Asaia sp. SF2.1]|nr:hypothetical protein P792_16615 [Asaia sp. SF2.1]
MDLIFVADALRYVGLNVYLAFFQNGRTDQ